MSGLREHQKGERRKRILAAARLHFLDRGYEATTIETIAESAEVSAVTVYKYYGTKGGVLLALITSSDAILICNIVKLIANPPADPFEAVNDFSKTINDHASSYFDRDLWRHAIATSVIEGGSEFGRGYAALDQELVRLLAKLLDEMKRRGVLEPGCNCTDAAEVLYNVHNARFIQFMTDESLNREMLDQLIRHDMEFVMGKLHTIAPTTAKAG